MVWAYSDSQPFPLQRPVSNLVRFAAIMAETQCDTCKRIFTPHGLSLHIAKTRKRRCRTMFSASQPTLAFTSIPGAASPLAQIANPTSQPSPDELSHNRFADDWMPLDRKSTSFVYVYLVLTICTSQATITRIPIQWTLMQRMLTSLVLT